MIKMKTQKVLYNWEKYLLNHYFFQQYYQELWWSFLQKQLTIFSY